MKICWRKIRPPVMTFWRSEVWIRIRIRWRKHSPVKAWLRKKKSGQKQQSSWPRPERTWKRRQSSWLWQRKADRMLFQKPEMHRIPPQGLKIPERQCLPAA